LLAAAGADAAAGSGLAADAEEDAPPLNELLLLLLAEVEDDAPYV
jgi:hypothetical protein